MGEDDSAPARVAAVPPALARTHFLVHLRGALISSCMTLWCRSA